MPMPYTINSAGLPRTINRRISLYEQWALSELEKLTVHSGGIRGWGIRIIKGDNKQLEIEIRSPFGVLRRDLDSFSSEEEIRYSVVSLHEDLK